MIYSVIRRHTLPVAVDKLPAGLCTCTMRHAWTATACTYDLHLCECSSGATIYSLQSQNRDARLVLVSALISGSDTDPEFECLEVRMCRNGR